MSLDIRPIDSPEEFDLYDDADKIGEIRQGFLSEEDIAEGESPFWEVTVWSLMGTGKEWKRDGESPDEARQWAHLLYQEFVAERRELTKGARPRSISVPMGGQKRRR